MFQVSRAPSSWPERYLPQPEPQGLISCPRVGGSTSRRGPGGCRKENWRLSIHNRPGSPACGTTGTQTPWARRGRLKTVSMKLNRPVPIPSLRAQPSEAFNCSSAGAQAGDSVTLERKRGDRPERCAASASPCGPGRGRGPQGGQAEPGYRAGA